MYVCMYVGMCVCMCVCMYVCMYVCMLVHKDYHETLVFGKRMKTHTKRVAKPTQMCFCCVMTIIIPEETMCCLFLWTITHSYIQTYLYIYMYTYTYTCTLMCIYAPLNICSDAYPTTLIYAYHSNMYIRTSKHILY